MIRMLFDVYSLLVLAAVIVAGHDNAVQARIFLPINISRGLQVGTGKNKRGIVIEGF